MCAVRGSSVARGGLVATASENGLSIPRSKYPAVMGAAEGTGLYEQFDTFNIIYMKSVAGAEQTHPILFPTHRRKRPSPFFKTTVHANTVFCKGDLAPRRSGSNSAMLFLIVCDSSKRCAFRCARPHRYCDGGSFTGDVEEPVSVPTPQGNKTIYYRGRRILDALFDELFTRRAGLASGVCTPKLSSPSTAELFSKSTPVQLSLKTKK